jgi:hypothetical protein
MKPPPHVSSVVLAAIAALALTQVVARSGIGGGFAFTSWVPIVLGIIVLSVLLRLLNSGMSDPHSRLSSVWANFNSYAGFAAGALFYAAATHVGDPGFGWWLTGGLIVQSLWYFAVYAALNARGVSDRTTARLQDLMVIAALGGIAAGIVWSLHIGTPLKTQILAGVFTLSAFFDYLTGRDPKAPSTLPEAYTPAGGRG